jgi:hypothetical protein
MTQDRLDYGPNTLSVHVTEQTLDFFDGIRREQSQSQTSRVPEPPNTNTNANRGDVAITVDAPCGPNDDPDECMALVDLAVSSRVQGWTFKKNWLAPDTSICDWELVGCNAVGRVKTLALSYNNMTGTIPRTIAKLKSLEDFDVEYNHIHSVIPPAINQLASLVEIGVGGNQLTGIVPASICELAAVNGPACDFSGNSFTCPLPPCLVANCAAVCTQ